MPAELLSKSSTEGLPLIESLLAELSESLPSILGDPPIPLVVAELTEILAEIPPSILAFAQANIPSVRSQ